MTVGEKIKKIRLDQGLSITELARRIGCTESYVRAYETGRRNPKPKSLERIAEALGVNSSALSADDMDGVKAMNMLFQVFQQYGTNIFEYTDTDNASHIAITFDRLSLIASWLKEYQRYESNLNHLKDQAVSANSDADTQEDLSTKEQIKKHFVDWMQYYPTSETNTELLEAQKEYDTKMGFIPPTDQSDI